MQLIKIIRKWSKNSKGLVEWIKTLCNRVWPRGIEFSWVLDGFGWELGSIGVRLIRIWWDLGFGQVRWERYGVQPSVVWLGWGSATWILVGMGFCGPTWAQSAPGQTMEYTQPKYLVCPVNLELRHFLKIQKRFCFLCFCQSSP